MPVYNLTSPVYYLSLEVIDLRERLAALQEIVDRMSSNIFKTIDSINVGTEKTIWTPAPGKKWRILGYQLAVTGAIGNLIFKDGISGPVIHLVPALTIGLPFSKDLLGKGIPSLTVDRPLRVIGAPLQLLSGVVYGIEE